MKALPKAKMAEDMGAMAGLRHAEVINARIAGGASILWKTDAGNGRGTRNYSGSSSTWPIPTTKRGFEVLRYGFHPIPEHSSSARIGAGKI